VGPGTWTESPRLQKYDRRVPTLGGVDCYVAADVATLTHMPISTRRTEDVWPVVRQCARGEQFPQIGKFAWDGYKAGE
jgi:hypothetical protein